MAARSTLKQMPLQEEAVKFDEEAAQSAYDGLLDMVGSVVGGEFGTSEASRWCSSTSQLVWDFELKPINDIYSLLELCARNGNHANQCSADILKKYFPGESDRRVVSPAVGDQVELHVSDLPLDKTLVPVKPTGREISVAARDILSGNAWQGSPCQVARSNETSDDFSYSYMGASGVAAYGLALSTLSFIVAIAKARDSSTSIPVALQDAAKSVKGIFLQAPSDIFTRLAQQFDAGFAAAEINRKVTDWDLLATLLEIAEGTMIATGATVDTLLDAYATQTVAKKGHQLQEATARAYY